MELTNQEIMFLTSVSRGRKPLGVILYMPKKEEKEDYINQTIESLVKKGILNEKRKLTREGADIVYFWEQYRNCETHVCINGIFAAVIPTGKLIVVAAVQKGYDFKIIMPETVMLGLLKESTFLRLGEEKRVRGKWESLDTDVWIKKINEMDGSILLKEYSHGKEIGENIYCWKETEGYLLNLKRKKVRNLSSGVMRRQVYTMLGGKGNGGEYGDKM